jgi:hypothetical protein
MTFARQMRFQSFQLQAVGLRAGPNLSELGPTVRRDIWGTFPFYFANPTAKSQRFRPFLDFRRREYRDLREKPELE